MHVKSKKMAIGGVLLALTVLCMVLGTVLESSTLFFLAIASFFVGIIIREFGMKTGYAFYIAGVLLGTFLAPNKFYVVTYAAMGFYILVCENVWRWMGKRIGTKVEFNMKQYTIAFVVIKYVLFNLMYITAVVGFSNLLFGRNLSVVMTIVTLAVGQIALYAYDKAYEYVQAEIWSKIRGKLLK